MKDGERAGWRRRRRGLQLLCVVQRWSSVVWQQPQSSLREEQPLLPSLKKKDNRSLSHIHLSRLGVKDPAVPGIQHERQKQSTFSVPPFVSSSISCVANVAALRPPTPTPPHPPTSRSAPVSTLPLPQRNRQPTPARALSLLFTGRGFLL